MVNLIGISGLIGSGKDTVAQMINDITCEAYEIKRFAGKLKQIAELFTGIPAEDFNRQEVKSRSLNGEWSDMSIRELLQKLGTDAIRNGLHENAWVNALFSEYREGSRWIIPDTRFPNEFEAIKRRGGIVIRIERETSIKSYHTSETALNGHAFDFTIYNNGSMENLQLYVLSMLAHFKIVNPGRVSDGIII